MSLSKNVHRQIEQMKILKFVITEALKVKQSYNKLLSNIRTSLLGVTYFPPQSSFPLVLL